MISLLTLALMGTAFAADSVDNDKDGFFEDATEAAKKDCDDTNARVHPGAKIVIGDGLDTNCDDTDDDAEREEAVAAAREAAAKRADPKFDAANPSPKATAAMDATEERFNAELDRCLEGQGFVNEDSTGVWGWPTASAKTPTCFDAAEGLSYERGGIGYSTPSDRRALGAARSAQAGVASLEAELGNPASGTNPATGLYAELEQIELAMVKADAATLEELRKAKVELEKRIGETEAALTALKVRMGNVESRVTAAEGDIRDLRSSGPILEIGLGGFLLAGRSQYEYKDGPMVRSGTGGGVVLAGTWGTAWNGNSLTLTLALGQGSEGSEVSDEDSLPLTMGSFAAGYKRGFGQLDIGVQAIAVVSSMGNPLDASVSSWGGGGGLTGAYYFPVQTRIGIGCQANAIAESFGANDNWDTGPAFVGSCGLVGGHGPQR